MSLEQLRKGIEEEKKSAGRKEDEIDQNTIEKIVKRINQKYAETGFEPGETPSEKLSELRGLIADPSRAKFQMQTVEELQEYQNPAVRNIGRTFLAFRSILNPFTELIRNLSLVRQTGYYLYSANLKFSVTQYLAITTTTAFLAGIGAAAIAGTLTILQGTSPLLILAAGIGVFLFTLVAMLLLPRSLANRRGAATGLELPFALRHMSTDLKAGLGLYKTIQTIAASDYGVLSEEFAKTITEIEEGTDAKEALGHLGYRTQSESLRKAVLHINRALKTGGNLSNAMNEIAQEVSFELQMRIRDFSEKTNFFGVIFIVGAIVFPVTIAILAGVANAPLGVSLLSLSTGMVLLFYALIMPCILLFLIIYLRMIQPRV